MITYFVYEKPSGRITNKISNQPLDHLIDRDDIGVFLLVDYFEGTGWTHYVVDGQLVERPTLAITQSADSIVADGVEVLTVVGAPEESIFTLYGPNHDTWTGDNEITVDVPGRYDLHVECWPYQTVVVSFDGT